MQTSSPATWRGRDIVLALAMVIAGDLLLNGGLLLLSSRAGVNLRENRDALTLLLIAEELIILVTVWLVIVVRRRVAWSQLGLRSFDAARGCGLSVALLFLSFAIRFCYVFAALAFGVRFGLQNVVNALSINGIGLLLTFIAAGIAAPIAEELFFRGMMYGGLRARFGILPAMLVSTTVFTALHFTVELFIPIFVLGLFLAWLYEKTGSLFPGILLHSANNSIAVIALVLFQALGLQIG